MKKISYSTNWMGPINMQWYRDRGLLEKQEPRWSDFLQETVEIEEIIERWAGGRIDIRGTESPFGDETSLPIMHGEDYSRFSVWLETYKTIEVETFDQILESYYTDGNSKIRFADDYFKDIEL